MLFLCIFLFWLKHIKRDSKVAKEMNRLKFSLVIIFALIGFCLGVDTDVSGKPWMRKELSPQERAHTLLSAMTTSEKLTMLHGTSGEYVGNVAGNERLGIPALNLQDGPQGIRDDQHPGTSTCWPSTLTIGATWDKDLAFKWGKAMAKEFNGKGANVLLGPGLNVARVPVNGRNFEYMSGGDPFLGYSLVQPLVKGIQSEPVIANAKHWVNNNQETDRSEVSANDDERTRHELYYPPFLGAIEAGVGSFMCSYNKINNVWSCENDETLNVDLREHLHFEGWVMSDWGATHSVSVDKGLDQEMPGDDYFGAKLTDMLTTGSISLSTIDTAVLRILTPMFTMGLFDTVNTGTLATDVTSPAHTTLARQLSAASHVLLKNDHQLLPLSKTEKRKNGKIAIFGHAALEPVIAGGGSGAVFPSHVVSPYQGLMDALHIPIPENTFSYSCNSTNLRKQMEIHQWGCPSAPASSVEQCCEQCGKLSGCHFFTFSSTSTTSTSGGNTGNSSGTSGGGHCALYPTDRELRPSSPSSTAEIVTGECVKTIHTTSTTTTSTTATTTTTTTSTTATSTTTSSAWQCNESTGICVSVHDGNDLSTAQSLAAEADVLLIAVAQYAREGADRDDLSLDLSLPTQQCQLVATGQNELVQTLAGVGTPVIVAVVAPGAVLMPWKDQVSAILYGFLPGEEYGHALSDLLFGDVQPSAKLPLTLPNHENEIAFTRSQYPGIQQQTNYTEQLLVDYRWYTAKKVVPAYPFGHGMSYTTFGMSDLTVTRYTATVTVTNTGTRQGAEVVQFYVTFPADAHTYTPPLQLKGFVKTVWLQGGEAQTVSVQFTERDLSVWDVQSHGWKLMHGEFVVWVGSSSADLRLSAVMVI